MTGLLKLAVLAARDAGKEILRFSPTVTPSLKKDGSPVTVADMAANEAIVRHLKETGIPILSEESGEIAFPYPPQLWVVDPLDGTKDFLSGTDDFSVMIGLLEKGRPVLGVVFAPALNTLYFATRGSGAYVSKGDQVTKLSVSTRMIDLRCLRSVNHFNLTAQKVAERLGAALIPRGSSGIKAGLLGEAVGDYFFSHGKLGEWDVCAPQIILEEAGGKVTDRFGDPLKYENQGHIIQKSVIFSNGVCHKKILEAVMETLEESQ